MFDKIYTYFGRRSIGMNKLALFEEKEIRRKWYNEDWYFSVIDVVEILTDSKRPRKYWSDLKKKLILLLCNLTCLRMILLDI